MPPPPLHLRCPPPALRAVAPTCQFPRRRRCLCPSFDVVTRTTTARDQHPRPLRHRTTQVSLTCWLGDLLWLFAFRDSSSLVCLLLLLYLLYLLYLLWLWCLLWLWSWMWCLCRAADVAAAAAASHRPAGHKFPVPFLSTLAADTPALMVCGTYLSFLRVQLEPLYSRGDLQRVLTTPQHACVQALTFADAVGKAAPAVLDALSAMGSHPLAVFGHMVCVLMLCRRRYFAKLHSIQSKRCIAHVPCPCLWALSCLLRWVRCGLGRCPFTPSSALWTFFSTTGSTGTWCLASH